MPAKRTLLTDAERAKRILETAREVGADNDPASFEWAFESVVRGALPPKKPTPDKK